MEKLLTDVAIEIVSHVAVATADPMEDLGSLRATCSQMRMVCGDTVVGRSRPLRRVLLRGITLGRGTNSMTTSSGESRILSKGMPPKKIHIQFG